MTRWRFPTAAVVVVALAGACNADSPADPTQAPIPDIAIRIVSGDRQLGIDGDTLPVPIVAEVTDLHGVPRANVEVSWSVNDQGNLIASHSRTDSAGRVSVTWVLGFNEDHEGLARANGITGTAFTASEPPIRALGLGEIGLLQPKTYEGSRQAIHPDFVRTPDDWSAYTQHLVLTPYRNSATIHENPSLFVSRSGYRWFPKPGATNPVVRPSEISYLSDPDMLFDPIRRELWLYYREVSAANRILLVRSRDGVAWTDPQLVVEAPNHSLISPSVVRRGPHLWLMWSVNGGPGGCSDATGFTEVRHSLDGIHWSRPKRLEMRGGGLDPWHIEVQWVEQLKEYWALFPVKEPYGCATQALYLATSANGLTWKTYPNPIMRAGQVPELQTIVYRSTFEYMPANDEVRFWISGANTTSILSLDWRTVVQRWRRTDLLTHVNLAPTFAARISRPVFRFDPP